MYLLYTYNSVFISQCAQTVYFKGELEEIDSKTLFFLIKDANGMFNPQGCVMSTAYKYMATIW